MLVLTDDALPLNEWRDVLFERLPRPDIEAAMSKVEAIAKPAETKPYDQLRTKWRGARRLFFEITTRIETDAAPGGKNVKAAISYLKGVDDWSSLAKMRGAPTAAIPKAWRQHVLDHEGRVRDPKACVFAIIDAWRLAIKRRDVFAKPGIRYGDPRRGMLEGESWHNSKLMVARALGRSLEADTEIDGLSRLLDEAYRHVTARAGDNSDLRFETVADKIEIVVTPRDKLDEPESLGLALNSIVHWNAVYMQETVRQLSEAGMPPLPADIARLSPISWRHINFLGRYDFSVPDAVANGGLRPLRQPNSEWDF